MKTFFMDHGIHISKSRIFLMLLILQCNSNAGYSADPNAVIEQLVTLENKGRIEAGMASQVQSLYSSKERLVRIEARRISSAACLRNGDIESAKAHLLKAREESKYEDGPSWDRLSMTQAELCIHEEKWMEALGNLEPVVRRANPTLNSIKAAITCGNVNVLRGDYPKAKSAFSWAKETAFRLFSDPGAEGVDLAAISKGMKLANAGPKKEKAKKVALPADRDLLIFQQAEKLFAQGQWEAAGSKYGEILKDFKETESKYVAPSTYSLSACLANLQRIDEAIKVLTVFTTNNPSGPFRGQARIALGDIYLEHRLDREAAEKCYYQASQEIESGNALDDSWKKIRYDSLLRNGLMLYLKGERAPAKELFSKAVSHAPSPPPVLDGFKPIPQPIQMLVQSCDSEVALTPIDVLRCAKDFERAALLCFLADFYLLIDNVPKASELLGKVVNAEREKIQANERQCAYASYRQAEALYRLEKFEESNQALNAYVKHYTQYEWTPEVLLKKGVYEYSRMKNLKAAIATFDLLSSNYPKHELAVAALWYKGTALYWDGHFKAAIMVYSDLNKRHPNNQFRDIIKNTLIPEINEKVKSSQEAHP